MTMLIVLCLLAYAGWALWPWWTPLAAFACATPLILLQIGTVNSWRAEAGLASHGVAAIAVTLAFNLALWLGAYWIARGARRLTGSISARAKDPQDSTIVQDWPVTAPYAGASRPAGQ